MVSTDDKKTETLLTFPCDFTIKIFGLANEEFKEAVLQLIRRILPDFSEKAIALRASSKSNYHALNVTVHVISKKQLDTIYEALSASPYVIMAL